MAVACCALRDIGPGDGLFKRCSSCPSLLGSLLAGGDVFVDPGRSLLVPFVAFDGGGELVDGGFSSVSRASAMSWLSVIMQTVFSRRPRVIATYRLRHDVALEASSTLAVTVSDWVPISVAAYPRRTCSIT